MARREHQMSTRNGGLAPASGYAPEPAIGQLDRSLVLRPHLEGAHELPIDDLHAGVPLRPIHAHRRGTNVAAGLGDHRVARAVAEVVEVKADLREDDKAVRDKLPVGLADLEADQVLPQVALHVSAGEPGRQLHARPEVGVEVHILDAANVSALVNIDPGLERAGKHIADQVQLVPPCPNQWPGKDW